MLAIRFWQLADLLTEKYEATLTFNGLVTILLALSCQLQVAKSKLLIA